MRVTAVVMLAALVATAEAQEPLEPQVAATPERGGIHVGLFGFGGTAGVDLEGDADIVFGYLMDVGDFFTRRVRLRPSVEIGVGSGTNTYVGNVDLMYRFTPDTAIAIPYAGFGIALQGHETCSSDANCPSLWAQFALGFELPFREAFNWMLEYRGEDALRRHRLFVGLVTRRGVP